MCRKLISMLLTAVMLVTVCSTGFTAYAAENANGSSIATTTEETTYYANTNQENIPHTKYGYNDSEDIENQPKDYIDGIMLTHYFNIMGAYDGQNNFKPNEPMKSSDLEYALKAIDKAEPEMTNFAGELLTVRALVHRIWLAAGKGSYIYGAETQEFYLSKYANLSVSYGENNDFANAWTFCVKNGIVMQFFDRQDFSANLTVTRAMAAYALANYYLFCLGFDVNTLKLNLYERADDIIEDEMMAEATATNPEPAPNTITEDYKEEVIVKKLVKIGKYNSMNIWLMYDKGAYRLLLAPEPDIVDGEEAVKIDAKFTKLPDWEGLRQDKNLSRQLSDWGMVCTLSLPPFQPILQLRVLSVSIISINPIADTNMYDFYYISDQSNDDSSTDEKRNNPVNISDQSNCDIDNNGVIDSNDCKVFLDCLTGIRADVDEGKLDINSDGEVNLLDVYYLYEITNSYFDYTVLSDGTAEITGYRGNGACITVPGIIDGHTVTGIAESAFEDNAYIESAVLSSSVVKLDDYAFSGCVKLNRITFNSDELRFGSFVFYGCPSLANVTGLPESFDVLTTNAFYTTPWYKNNVSEFCCLLLNNGTLTITMYDEANESVDIPSTICGKTVSEINQCAFAGNEHIKSVEIPHTVTKIDDWAFGNCINLETVTIWNSDAYISESAFDGCSKLTIIHGNAHNYEEPEYNYRIIKFNNVLRWSGIRVCAFKSGKSYGEILKIDEHASDIRNKINAYRLPYGFDYLVVYGSDGKTSVDIPIRSADYEYYGYDGFYVGENYPYYGWYRTSKGLTAMDRIIIGSIPIYINDPNGPC